jgi:hypothetical protein
VAISLRYLGKIMRAKGAKAKVRFWGIRLGNIPGWLFPMLNFLQQLRPAAQSEVVVKALARGTDLQSTERKSRPLFSRKQAVTPLACDWF